jgi:RNA polymerase sigma-70 factor (ECF subfamily)
MSDQDFAAVLERARQGDHAAMGRLVEEYEPEIRRVARRRLGPNLRALFGASDLVQSVHRSLLLSLRRNKFKFDGPEDLVALAVTMMKRKAARKWARRQRELEIMHIWVLMQPRVNAQRTLELAGEVQELLETLKVDERQLLRLYLEGYSTKQIADDLGLESDSLRVRRSRLFHKLRRAGLDID